MENLIFSLNATVPVFLMMILGMIFKKVGIISDKFASDLNKFVFLIPLPILVFKDLAIVNFEEIWDTSFVLFCLIATILSIIIASVISYFFKDKSIQGEFIQASYRSSAALLGMALINNIYGSSPMVSLMIIGCVPVYNIIAVIVLSFFKENNSLNKDLILKTLKGIITNPIIIAIVIGILWSLIKIPYPEIFSKVVNNISALASPLGLMAMGASFNFDKALGKIKPALIATFLKLFGFALIFLPVAIQLGFRDDKLVSILIMLGSATAVASFVMAKGMGHEGTLSSSVVLLTTILSGFSITFWIFVLKCLNLI